jgi:hypothetical protein
MSDFNDGDTPAEASELTELLGWALAEADPVPDHALAAAKEAIMWRTIDAELAELVFDSATDGLVGVRGADTARQVTFRAPGVEIEVMVMAEGERRLIGQLVPPQSATVEMRLGSTVRETGTDRLGRFQFTGVPTGSIQLVIATEGGGKVVTEWVVM